jgi:diguanylate cyclase (GGDEF)-like protein
MARLTSDDEEHEERKQPFTLRPPARIIVAIKQLAREDQIASERAMGAYCLRAGVALHALRWKNCASLSDEEIETILAPFETLTCACTCLVLSACYTSRNKPLRPCTACYVAVRPVEHSMKQTLAASDILTALPSVLHAFRLRLLKLLLTCGCASIALIWLFEGAAGRVSTIDRIAYPALLVIFAVCGMMLFIQPKQLELLERVCFATFAIYVTVHAQPIALADLSTYANASLAQWFPLVYTAAFFFLPTRHAVIISILIYLSVLVPNLVAALLQGPPQWSSDFGLLLVNVFCSHPVYIVTLSGIARLKTYLVQSKAQADAMSAAANIDYLTGVASRRAAAHVLQQALRYAQEQGEMLSVILLDIDHFKRINDTFGHDVGDRVLIEVAGTLRQHLRGADILGRWGGEEFIIVATAVGNDRAVELAERLRTLVATHSYVQVGRVTLSLGIATSRSYDTPEGLVKRADAALYQAKQRGRNRVEVVPSLTNH